VRQEVIYAPRGFLEWPAHVVKNIIHTLVFLTLISMNLVQTRKRIGDQFLETGLLVIHFQTQAPKVALPRTNLCKSFRILRQQRHMQQTGSYNCLSTTPLRERMHDFDMANS
jgi:hypothetical protein